MPIADVITKCLSNKKVLKLCPTEMPKSFSKGEPVLLAKLTDYDFNSGNSFLKFRMSGY